MTVSTACPRTNRDTELFLEHLARGMSETAFLLRARTENVLACAGMVDANGRVTMAGISIDDQEARVAALRELAERSNAIGFVFVYDGILTHCHRSDPCNRCRGATCNYCRWTGKRVTGRCEAIVTVALTKWGWSQATEHPYTVQDGRIVKLPPIVPVATTRETTWNVYANVFPSQETVQ